MLETVGEGRSGRSRTRVLLIDDDESMGELLAAQLLERGFEPATETSPARALRSIDARRFDVVVTDLRMNEMDGVQLCEELGKTQPDLPVVLLTAHGSLDTAVAALRVRAHDFLMKPPDIDELVAALERAVHGRPLVEDVEGATPDPSAAFEGIIGASPVMGDLFRLIARVASVDSPVLITGESGSGKELVAQAVHQRSERRSGPFVPLNCAAIPANLLEAELFGHVKGAFTDARDKREGLFERARGGTIFLDEIAELDLSLQLKVLRALQERTIRPVGSDREIEVDVRLVTATNVDLSAALERRLFRADLFYRINVIEVRVPPLRERERDVLLLAQAFVERAARAMRRDVVGLSPPCAAKLLAYSWPGNVRELANVIERAVALTRSRQVTAIDLPRHLRGGVAREPSSESAEDLVPLEELERRHIRRVIKATGGNKTLAAQILGVDRRTLYRKDWQESPELVADDGDRKPR